MTARAGSKHWAGSLIVCVCVGASACHKIPLLAPNLSTIKLSSDTTSVDPNGEATVRATVVESSGTPVQNGTSVFFSTNLGTISPREAQTVKGVATTRFMPNGVTGVAEIRATSGSAGAADAANPSLKLIVGTP
jgi:hypothetical protein